MPKKEVLPEALREKLRFHLNELLVQDESDFENRMSELNRIVDAMAAFEGRLANDPKSTLAFLTLEDEFTDKAGFVIVYRYLEEAIDTRKSGGVSTMQGRFAQLESRLVFADLELKSVDEATWSKWETEVTGLKVWHERYRRARRSVPHTLSRVEEELLAKLSTPLFSWQGDLYELLVQRSKFAEFEVDGKTLHAMRDQSALLRIKDRDTREKAWYAYYEGYLSQRDLYAFTLSRLISNINTSAVISKFDDALHSQAFSYDLDREQIAGLWKSVEAMSPLLQRYLKADRIRRGKLLGIAEPQPWDMEQEATDFELPVYAADEAFNMIREAMQPLGSEVAHELDKLLSPGAGRVDMYGGPNRTPGAFSINSGRTAGFFYIDQYHGTVQQMRTIAHEAGHTVHHLRIKSSGLPLYLERGPTYVTETAAMTYEEFLQNLLIANETDQRTREYFQLEQLRGMIKTIRIGLMARFEATLYEAVRDREAAGKGPLSADDFDALATPIAERMTPFYPQYKQYLTMWQYIPHLYGHPQYLLNYLVSSLLTMELMGRYEQDNSFAQRIAKLFSHPFDRPVAQMLNEVVGINLSSPDWYRGAEERLAQKVAEFEATVAKM